jgi:hypothetical protein
LRKKELALPGDETPAFTKTDANVPFPFTKSVHDQFITIFEKPAFFTGGKRYGVLATPGELEQTTA